MVVVPWIVTAGGAEDEAEEEEDPLACEADLGEVDTFACCRAAAGAGKVVFAAMRRVFSTTFDAYWSKERFTASSRIFWETSVLRGTHNIENS